MGDWIRVSRLIPWRVRPVTRCMEKLSVGACGLPLGVSLEGELVIAGRQGWS